MFTLGQGAQVEMVVDARWIWVCLKIGIGILEIVHLTKCWDTPICGYGPQQQQQQQWKYIMIQTVHPLHKTLLPSIFYRATAKKIRVDDSNS